MSKHVAVNPLDHRTLRIREERSEDMGDGMMCCITFPEEFRKVQAHYPILFQKNQDRDGFLCLALFGFENGENLFLTNDKWDAHYVPLAADVQPFLIGQGPEKDSERKVVLNMDSPRISDGEGQRLFDDTGMATTYLETISKKLAYLDEGFRSGGDYVKMLEKHDLLEPLSIDITLRDGNQNRLSGFHTIREEKLFALNGAALEELQNTAYLLPTFMAVASLSKLSDLIERKDQLLPNEF